MTSLSLAVGAKIGTARTEDFPLDWVSAAQAGFSCPPVYRQAILEGAGAPIGAGKIPDGRSLAANRFFKDGGDRIEEAVLFFHREGGEFPFGMDAALEEDSA